MSQQSSTELRESVMALARQMRRHRPDTGVTLSQMENQRTVRNISRAQNELLASLGIFRKGPKIDGHKNAGCFLPPKNSAEKLDMMFCSAYEGDVLVTATVSGIKPLDGPTVARFLTAQLDRITDPGEAV